MNPTEFFVHDDTGNVSEWTLEDLPGRYGMVASFLSEYGTVSRFLMKMGRGKDAITKQIILVN